MRSFTIVALSVGSAGAFSIHGACARPKTLRSTDVSLASPLDASVWSTSPSVKV